MNSTNLGRRGERGTQEGNWKQQTCQIRTRETGPKGGRAASGHCDTAPAGQPSAGRGGETGRCAKGEATQGHRAKWGRAARCDRVGVPVERQEKEEKAGRRAKYEATCEPKGGEGKGY